MEQEIKGKESGMKTASQIRHLWLDPGDKNQFLRDLAIQSGIAEDLTARSILHLGMATNVFPLFREVCGVVGRLTGLQGICNRQEVCQRVMEKYGNPTSVPRMVDRVFQTLIDWQFIEKAGTVNKIRRIEIADPALGGWFLGALLFSQPERQLALPDLQTLPERLGIRVKNEREVIRETPNLYVIRDGTAGERVGLRI